MLCLLYITVEHLLKRTFKYMIDHNDFYFALCVGIRLCFGNLTLVVRLRILGSTCETNNEQTSTAYIFWFLELDFDVKLIRTET